LRDRVVSFNGEEVNARSESRNIDNAGEMARDKDLLGIEHLSEDIGER